MPKYYLSLTVDYITQRDTWYADSPYFDTVGEVEDYLRKTYPAKDSMWITTCHVGQSISGLPEVVCVLQDGDSRRWGRIVKTDHYTDPITETKETTIGLSSLVIQLTGNRTAELGSSDKIDIVTPDGAHRFSIDELRLIVKFWDATQTILNEA